jgi:hypothetical protein
MRCMTRIPVLTRHRWAGRTVPNMATGNAWGCFVSVYMNDESMSGRKPRPVSSFLQGCIGSGVYICVSTG